MWTLEYVLSQVCVVIGMIIIGASSYVKNKKLILYFSLINSVVFGVHYLLLGAYTGMILNIVGIVRGLWYYYTENSSFRSRIIALVVIILCNLILGIFSFNYWIDIAAIAAGIAYSYAIWQKSICYYRWSAILETIAWILYNVYLMSIFAIMSQSILLVVVTIGLVKYYIDKRKNTKQGNLQKVIEK